MIKPSFYWFSKILTYIAGVILLLVISLVLLLMTQTGSQSLVRFSQQFLPEYIEVKNFQGTLLKQFSIDSISVQLPDGPMIQINHLSIHWDPAALFDRSLSIHTLQAETVTLVLPRQLPEETPDEATGEWNWPPQVELPDIQLPISMMLERLYVEHIQVVLPEQQLDFYQALIQAHASPHFVTLEQAQVTSPYGQAQLQAKIQLADDHMIEAKARIQGQIPELGELDATLNLVALPEKLIQLSVDTQGLADTSLSLSVQKPLSATPKWQSKLYAQDIQHPAVQEVVSDLIVQLEAHGQLDQAHISLLSTGTTAEFGLMSSQLQGSWQHIQGEGLSQKHLITFEHLSFLASELGFDLTLKGYTELEEEALQAKIQGTTQYKDFPETEFDIHYLGSLLQADQIQVDVQSSIGSLQLSGAASWHEQQQWDLTLQSNALQLYQLIPPELTSSYLEGSYLTATIQSQGQWQDTLQAELNIIHLQTQIDQQDTELKAHLSFQDDLLTLDQLQLHLGNGSLHLQGQGQLPSFSFVLNAHDLSFDGYSVATVQSHATLDYTLELLPRGSLVLHQLQHQEQTLIDLLWLTSQSSLEPNTLETDNNALQYLIDFYALTDELKVTSQSKGYWHKNTWWGHLQQLTFNHEALKDWQLQQPTATHFASQHMTVDPFCLSSDHTETKLCAELRWHQDQEEILADIQLNDLNLALIEPWLPNEIQVDGALDVLLYFHQKKQEVQYHGNVDLQHLSFALPEQDLFLHFRPSTIMHFKGDVQQLTGQLNLGTDMVDGGFIADIQIDDPFGDAYIKSTIDLDFNSLHTVSLAVPQIQQVQGMLNGDFVIDGPLLNPNIQGELAIHGGAAEIPAAGLAISKLDFFIRSPQAEQEMFLMQGEIHSGEGYITIDGHYDLSTHIANFDFQGERFTAMQSREIELIVSPETQLTIGPEILKVRGQVMIDQALITPPKIDSTNTSSSDTIIVRGEDTIWQSQQSEGIDLDIQVDLGENFHVDAYGFDGRLAGRLRVIENKKQVTSAVGNINIPTGNYEIYGQALSIERGTLVYSGGVISNPGLDMRVAREIDLSQVTVGARVGGTLQEPNLQLYSTPAMQDAEILSYLIFGRGFSNEQSGDQNMLLMASLALGMHGGNMLGEKLSSSLGIDEISFDGGDDIESTSLYFGKQLSKRLYIKYGIGLIEPVSTFFIRYQLNRFLHLETQTGTLGSGADLFYSIER